MTAITAHPSNLIGKKDPYIRPTMTTPTTPAAAPAAPAPFVSTPAEKAIGYFEAVLHRDHAVLISQYKWTLDECQALNTEAQTFAASKLLAAGNILNRKAAPPAAPVTAPPAAAPTKAATFRPYAGDNSKYKAVA